jgi:hypothetical protein
MCAAGCPNAIDRSLLGLAIEDFLTMNGISLTLSLLLLLPVQEDDTQAAALQDVRVHHKGKTYSGLELPEDLGKGPPAAVEAWAGWVLEFDYRMDLTADGRLLLISPARNGKLARQLRLIDQTIELFDQLVPAPPREVIVEELPADDPADEEDLGDDELPEDPEGGPVGWKPSGEAPSPFTYSYEWGMGTWPIDTETCVLFVVHDERDYGALVDKLAELQDYLKPWAKVGKKYTGFVHERPLVAAYIEHASGQEEWDPDNEVVHRTAQMLFVRRFSSLQPYWAVQGFAWYVEMKLRRGIYCFPYRDEFVWATEHTGWNNELKNAFADRKDEPLQLEEFVEWRRGKYDARVARIVYGMVGFLVRHHPGALSLFLEDLRLFSLEDNKIDNGDGTWERDEDYVIPLRQQGIFLGKHFGKTVLDDVTGFFRLGKKYKRK